MSNGCIKSEEPPTPPEGGLRTWQPPNPQYGGLRTPKPGACRRQSPPFGGFRGLMKGEGLINE
jgi:hypothetical protein